MRLVVRLLRAGIVHGDFNEFNLMLDQAQGTLGFSCGPINGVDGRQCWLIFLFFFCVSSVESYGICKEFDSVGE